MDPNPWVLPDTRSLRALNRRTASAAAAGVGFGRRGNPRFPKWALHITPDAQIPFVKCPMSPLRDGTGLQWQWSASVACEGAGGD